MQLAPIGAAEAPLLARNKALEAAHRVCPRTEGPPVGRGRGREEVQLEKRALVERLRLVVKKRAVVGNSRIEEQLSSSRNHLVAA